MSQSIETLISKVTAASKTRQLGNDCFKTGDNAGALRHWHGVIFALKGLDGEVQEAYKEVAEPKIQELSLDDESAAAAATESNGAAAEVKPPAEGEPDYTTEKGMRSEIKTLLKTTYLNMSACLHKQDKFQRALEYAEQANKLDPGNAKARFREAQARVGLGDTDKAKNIIQDLVKENGPDAAMTKLLEAIKKQEKVRDDKHKNVFKGYLSKASKPLYPEEVDDDDDEVKPAAKKSTAGNSARPGTH